MTKIFLFISLFVVLALVTSGVFFKYRLDYPKDSGDLEAAIDEAINRLEASKLFQGSIVGVYKNGRMFVKAYGNKDAIDKQPLSVDGVFEIGSISKLFTASLLQIMADEGVVALDATLGDVLEGRVAVSEKISGITLRQLARHTSGLPRLPKSFLAKSIDEQNPYNDFSVDDIKAFLIDPEPLNTPGKHDYSNLGMGLLGHVLAWVSDKSWDALVQERILTPLDMKHSGQSMSPEMMQRFVPAHNAKGEVTPHWDMPVLAGAGALRSTVEDLLKFIAANLDNDTDLSRSLQRTHPTMGQKNSGLGWMQSSMLERFFGNKSAIWHNGMVGGHSSYLSIDHETQTGVVVLNNQNTDVTMEGIMLTRAIRVHSFAPTSGS